MPEETDVLRPWLTRDLVEEIASKALAPLQDDDRYEQHETPTARVEAGVAIIFEVLAASGYSIVKTEVSGA